MRANPANTASNPADFVVTGNGCGITAVSAIVGVGENIGDVVNVRRIVVGIGVEKVVTFVERVLVGLVGFVVETVLFMRGF
jgi:hypothetical protein